MGPVAAQTSTIKSAREKVQKLPVAWLILPASLAKVSSSRDASFMRGILAQAAARRQPASQCEAEVRDGGEKSDKLVDLSSLWSSPLQKHFRQRLPPHGFTGKVHRIKAEVGGTYRMSFTSFTTGDTHSFGGEFVELVPNERIRHADKFDDPNLPGQMLTTISLRTVSVGTEVSITQEGIPSAIPVESCYLGGKSR